MNHGSNSAMLYLLIVHLLLSLHSEAFNIDDKFPIRYSQPPAGNYFGYTVAFMSNPQGKWVIVGAPRANSTYGRRKVIDEPGEIYSCKVDSSSIKTCLPIKFENGVSENPNQDFKENNGWLGVTLDVADDYKHLVVCGHLEKNLNYEPIGVCYAANLNNTGRKEFEITENELNVDGQKGLSAQFLKNTASLIVTTIKNYSKSKVGYIKNNSASTFWHLDAHYDYFGYALTSGHFFSQEEVQVASGAPRAQYKGKVYIKQGINKTSITALSGKQIGEYFGAALCAVDLDNDGWDDLLVGAPLYSEDCDEGKVYVFKGSKTKQMYPQREITGSEISGRFGSNIAAIGDLDLDGFQDIAIGAPYENNGKGAVYIYHGSLQGINPKHQQKLIAKGITRGFGISVAGGMDTDANKHPDIAIGAYGSGEIFIYRTRPVINVTATMKTDKEIIDVDEGGCMIDKYLSCFHLVVCFRTQITTAIIRTLAVDTLLLDGVPSRVYIQVSEKSWKTITTTNILIDNGRSICETIQLIVPKKPTDYFTPIKIQLSFKLSERNSSSFCPTCPLLNPSTRTEREHEVRFKTKCNGKCNADLKVDAWIPGFKNTSVVIGSTNQLSLKVNVTNLGDAAYITNLTIDIPRWMTFDNIPTNCHKKSPLYCDVANILETRKSSILEFLLNVENELIIEVDNFTITCIAFSQSQEQNEKDNVFLVVVPIRSVTDIFVLGSTDEEQIFYDRNKVNITEDSTVNFSHVFSVGNNGPTDLRTPLRFRLRYPAFIGVESDTPLIQISLNTSVPVSCNASFIHQYVGTQEINFHDDVALAASTSHVSRRGIQQGHEVSKGMQEEAPENVAILNCDSARCSSAWCTIAPLRKDASVTLSFTIFVRLKALAENMGEKDAVVIVTEAQLYREQLEEHQPQIAKVMTEIKSGGKPSTPPVDTWIIVASVVGGLIALILLILILYKLGFFKRPKKEEMKQLRRNTEFLTEVDDSNKNT